MKQKILLSSAGSSILATLLSIVGILMPKVHNAESLLDAGRFFALAGVFGVLGIALFFVGFAFPKA